MKLFYGIIILIPLMFSFQIEKENIERMKKPSFDDEIINIVPITIDFNDTLHNNTLLVHTNVNGIPVKYSRKLVTSVCIESECRLVNVELFWNITGRYLGYKIPAGEFLSKTKHKPFKPEEYDRLHELLSDQNSALANYSIKQLVPPLDSTMKVDAVSSATIAAVLDYIVEGAVYTTYTLWHITYGSTKREIEKLTTEKLSNDLILKILDSKNLSDQIWVLNQISNKIEITPELLEKLIEIISGNDIYLAERSLYAIKAEMVNDEIQKELISVYSNSGFLQKRLILQKLKEVSAFNIHSAEILSTELPNSNGSLIETMLDLFKAQQIKNEIISNRVAELLKNDNRFIANQAYQYLKDIHIQDKNTLRSIQKFEKKMLR